MLDIYYSVPHNLITEVEECNYLGNKIINDGRYMKEIKARISVTQRIAFSKKRKVISGRQNVLLKIQR